MAHILIIEENYLTYQLLYYFLRRKNHSVHQASNGMEAISRLNERKIDLVIFDISTPAMDGITLLDQVRYNDRNRKVPVVVLADAGSDQVKQAALDRGAAALITKPFHTSELGKIISESLSFH